MRPVRERTWAPSGWAEGILSRRPFCCRAIFVTRGDDDGLLGAVASSVLTPGRVVYRRSPAVELSAQREHLSAAGEYHPQTARRLQSEVGRTLARLVDAARMPRLQIQRPHQAFPFAPTI